MDYKVLVSDQAKEDIANIYSYILYELESEINAKNLLNKLKKAISDLCFMADAYHLYPKEPWLSKKVHYFTIGNYSIFYTIDDDTAKVIHITYGRRDLDKILEE